MTILNKLFHDISLELKKLWLEIRDYIKFFVLISEKNIAGLSINNENIHYVSVNQEERNYKNSIINTRYYPISSTDSLNKVLLKLKKSLKDRKTDSVVVSLPGHLFYSTVLQLPRLLNDDQLRKMMESYKSSVAPISVEEIYIDWEKIDCQNSAKQDIFLWIAKKEEIKHYIEGLKSAHFLIRKIEPATLSIARIIKKNRTFVLVNLSKTDAYFSIIERKVPRFNHYTKTLYQNNPLLSAISTEGKNIENIISNNILKLINFYQAQKTAMGTMPIKQVIVIGNLSKASLSNISLATSSEIKLFRQQDLFKQLPINIDEAALGATQQKFLPQDYNQIDQMIVSNEKDYKEKKIINVLKFWHNLSWKILSALIVILIVVYLFMIIIDRKISKKIIALAPGNFLDIIEAHRNFNSNILTSNIEGVVSWSKIIEKLFDISIPGIKISDISTDDQKKSITLNITASKDSKILEFKNTLEKLDIFKGVIIPFKALNNQEDLNFILELELKKLEILNSKF